MSGQRRAVAVLLGALLALSSAAARAAAGNPEIDYLLNWVGASACTFVRNGSDYSASEAAAHLSMKTARAGRRVKTAEVFIDRVASGSSLSGKPYRVRCPDSPEQTARAWLTKALAAHRSGTVISAP